ncbi:PREDICTED: uncharacterized protein LOC108356901 [Rhagoletis zephyria]|uniref:uncharacterized protein LOC108356901 n=1 Tax=Rhagoletis zephyria TaxID=28612 RepID=UPI0008112B4A|nr:PREDICTED: uncharacterized protein LOC108356901 [Rhagoletis zephyria]
MQWFILQSVAAHPHLSFSALYASEEDGFITNAEYAERSLSAEARRSAEELEKSKEANSSNCTRAGGDHVTPKTSELTYKIFVKVLMRDSRQVVKNKLRELKESHNGSGADISYFFVVLKKINKLRLVNESQEGQVMHDAIREIVTEKHDNSEDATAWLNKMFDRIFCLALKANSDEDIDGLVDSFTIEEEISQHFNVFIQFWLNYTPTKNTKDSTVDATAETDRVPNETLCVVDIPNLPLNTTNITHSIFAEIVIRDSQKVAQRKLDELKSLESEQYKWYIADLTKILEHIDNRLYDNTTEDGELIYKSLKSINEMNGEDDSTWLDHIVDRIFCIAKEVRMESEMKSAAESISIEETIEGHFEIFKQLWLNCKNLYIHRGESIYKLCKSQRKYYDE